MNPNTVIVRVSKYVTPKKIEVAYASISIFDNPSKHDRSRNYANPEAKIARREIIGLQKSIDNKEAAIIKSSNIVSIRN